MTRLDLGSPGDPTEHLVGILVRWPECDELVAPRVDVSLAEGDGFLRAEIRGRAKRVPVDGWLAILPSVRGGLVRTVVVELILVRRPTPRSDDFEAWGIVHVDEHSPLADLL